MTLNPDERGKAAKYMERFMSKEDVPLLKAELHAVTMEVLPSHLGELLQILKKRSDGPDGRIHVASAQQRKGFWSMHASKPLKEFN
eukprot:106963-Chlamydomonas_euryale.AAC.1